ncbi:MAG: hypothetical protein KAH84_12060 [Thiomargarita sp.]|nr:hypothetical protein [Thiomargarita sp.]
MINSIRQETIVKKGGKVEILSPELPIGAKVEVIVLIEPFESEAERWLCLLADNQQLEQAAKEFEQELVDKLCGSWSKDSSLKQIFSEIENQRHIEPREVNFDMSS